MAHLKKTPVIFIHLWCFSFVFCKFEKLFVTIFFAEGQLVMDWRPIEGNWESSLRREFFSVKEKNEELERKR